MFNEEELKLIYIALGHIPVTRDSPSFMLMVNLSNKIKKQIEENIKDTVKIKKTLNKA